MDSAAKHKLTKLLSCPVDWEQETGLGIFSYEPLEWDWHAAFAAQAVSGQELWLIERLIRYGNLLELDEDDEELPQLMKNIELRLPYAIEAYKKRAGRLAGLTFIRPSEHGKHFVLNANRKEVILQSRGGPSLFFKNYFSDDLKVEFWLWFLGFFDFIDSDESYRITVSGEGDDYSRARVWNDFMCEHQRRVCADVAGVIGAVDGSETSFICFDIHLDTKAVHAYPISGDEASAIMDGEIETANFLRGC
jgi:hypothetical protein